MIVALQKYWTPIFGFAVWLSTSALAFLSFNIQTSAFNETPGREVVGWTAIGTALTCAVLLSLPKWLTAFRKRSIWAMFSLACAGMLALNIYGYAELRGAWTCTDEKFDLTLVVGVHSFHCQELLENTGRNPRVYFSDQSALLELRFAKLVALYVSQWILVTATLVSIFHANKLRLVRPKKSPSRTK